MSCMFGNNFVVINYIPNSYSIFFLGVEELTEKFKPCSAIQYMKAITVITY